MSVPPRPQRARRHHTVPRFYLERFASSRGRLIRVPLDGKPPHPIAATDATVHKDFYTATLADGSESTFFETALGEIEGMAATAFRRLIDERIWPMSSQDRETIALWTAAQHLRSPASRQASSEVQDTVFKLHVAFGGKRALRAQMELGGRPVSDQELDGAWAEISDFDSYAVEPHPNDHLRSIRNLIERAATSFLARRWNVFHFERKTLATSDTPVVLVPAEDHEPWRGIGFVTAGAIFVPLSRRTALLMSAVEPGEDNVVPPTAWFARLFNQATTWGARRALFHHPDDDPLAGLPLPPPRERETGGHEAVRDAVGLGGWLRDGAGLTGPHERHHGDQERPDS